MAELFASGRIIDLVLVLVVAEMLALRWWLPRSGSSLRLGQLLPNLAAGGALLVALRLALAQADWQWLAAALTLALLAHLADLGQRWTRGRT